MLAEPSPDRVTWLQLVPAFSDVYNVPPSETAANFVNNGSQEMPYHKAVGDDAKAVKALLPPE